MKYQLIHQGNSSLCMETLKEYIVEDQKKETFIIDGKIELSELPLGIINSVLDWLNEYDPKSRQNILKLIKLGHLTLVCDEENHLSLLAVNAKFEINISKIYIKEVKLKVKSHNTRSGAGAKCSSFTSLWFRALARGGLEMCCNWRGLLIGAFPNAPKRRNARGVKKLKPLAQRFPKALIQTLFLFSVIVQSAKMCQKAAFGLHLTSE